MNFIKADMVSVSGFGDCCRCFHCGIGKIQNEEHQCRNCRITRKIQTIVFGGILSPHQRNSQLYTVDRV